MGLGTLGRGDLLRILEVICYMLFMGGEEWEEYVGPMSIELCGLGNTAWQGGEWLLTGP